MSNTYVVCNTCDGEGDIAPAELSARQRKRLAHSGKAPQRADVTGHEAYSCILPNALNVDLMSLSAHKLYGPKV